MFNSSNNWTNESNEWITSWDNSVLNGAIFSITILNVSILIDLLFLYITISSRSKLIRTEYYILISIGCLSILNKQMGVFKTLLQIVDLRFLGILNCILVYTVDLDLGFTYYMIFFYYSLFHLATIDRCHAFLVLFDVLHKHPRNYLIYLTSVFVLFAIFITSYSILFSRQIFLVNETSICTLIDSYTAIAPMLTYLLCSITPFVYLFAIMISINLMTRRPKSELVNYRRGLIVSVKFFLFSLSVILITIPQYLFHLMYYFFGYFDVTLYESLHLTSELLFITQTAFLLYVNCQLRRGISQTIIQPLLTYFNLLI